MSKTYEYDISVKPQGFCDRVLQKKPLSGTR